MIDYAKEFEDFGTSPAAKRRQDARIILPRLIDACGHGSVLDVGCGDGQLVARLLREGIDAHGVDVVGRLAKEGNQRSPGRFTAGSVLDLAFPAERFDTVVAIDLLQYLAADDVPVALRALARVTKRFLYVVISPASPADRQWRKFDKARSWWGTTFLQAGFRRYPRQYRLSSFGELLDDSAPATFVFEKAPVFADHAIAARDPLRQSDSANHAALECYQLVSQYVRPGDTVLDCAAGTGSGIYLLKQNSLGHRFTGLLSPEDTTYAREQFPGTGEFINDEPTAFLQKRAEHSIDLLIDLSQTQLNAAALRRVLIPGGRLVLAAPTPDAIDRLREQLAPGFLIEAIHELSWKGSLVIAMSDPTLDGPTVPYRETVFANVQQHSSVEYAKWYCNPWIVHSMVHIGYRMRSQSALNKLAERVMADSPNDSADYGTALCLLAYAALDSMAAEGIDQLLGPIESYAAIQTDNPHVIRWTVSLAFVLGQLQLRVGRLGKAREAFARCSTMDSLAFSVHLTTKTTDAFFLAGWLALTQNDVADARACWSAGLRFGDRLLARPMSDVLMNPTEPNIYDHGDGMREFTLAIDNLTRCANGLNLLARQDRGEAIVWTDLQKSFRTRADRIGLDLLEAQQKVAMLVGDIDQVRKELVDRTIEVDAARHDLVARTSELDAARAELVAARQHHANADPP